MNPEREGADSKLKFNDDAIKFSDHPSFNFALAILWVAAIFSVLGTLFLWWTNNDTKTSLKEKESQKNSIVSEMVSPTYTDVEKKASSFKSAVSALSAAAEERYSMDQFLKTFYTKITNDATVTSISVTQDGSLNITGQTKSYRSVAELLVALSSWKVLKEIDLTSVSMATGDQAANGASFSISAKVDKTAGSTVESTSDNLSSGGTSEAVQ